MTTSGTDSVLSFNYGTHTLAATNFSGSGASLTNLNATNLSSGTVPIARLGDSGTKSGSTFLAGDNTFKTVTVAINSIANDANNRVITSDGDGTATAESNLTFDGTTLTSSALTVSGATSPVTFNHTGGAALSLARSSKVFNFNANYGAAGTHATMDVSSGMELRLAHSGTDRIKMDSSGNWVPQNDNQRNLGTSSLRWANIYSADIHCSNKGSKNDVDGTWGDYTIQEGESDLFLINNRSGKKYKFNLTEVN